MGLSFIGADSFLAIPGLRTWVDGRYNIVPHTLDALRVAAWNGLSSEALIFTARYARSPRIADGKWVEFISEDGAIISLLSPRRDFRFLHNGSPYGIYSITAFSWNELSSHTILSTTGASGTGIQFLIQHNVSNGRIALIVRNSGTSVRSSAVNNLRPGFPNETDTSEARIVSNVFLGAGVPSNQIMRYGTLVTTTNAPALPSEYSLGDHSNFVVGASSSLEFFHKIGVILIYDWTGFSPAEISNFDARARTLLTDILPIFQ